MPGLVFQFFECIAILVVLEYMFQVCEAIFALGRN